MLLQSQVENEVLAFQSILRLNKKKSVDEIFEVSPPRDKAHKRVKSSHQIGRPIVAFSRPATATAVTRPTTGKYVAESQLEEVHETPDICIEDIDNDSSILGDEVTTDVH